MFWVHFKPVFFFYCSAPDIVYSDKTDENDVRGEEDEDKTDLETAEDDERKDHQTIE